MTNLEVQTCQAIISMARELREIKELLTKTSEQIKAPKIVNLRKVGDFYECYGDCAVLLSEAVGLTLSNRRNGDCLTGFPMNALTEYTYKASKKNIIFDIKED